MLCYAMLHDVTINYSTCNCGAGGGVGIFRNWSPRAETSAYPIPDAKFPYAISHFIYVILIPLLD